MGQGTNFSLFVSSHPCGYAIQPDGGEGTPIQPNGGYLPKMGVPTLKGGYPISGLGAPRLDRGTSPSGWMGVPSPVQGRNHIVQGRYPLYKVKITSLNCP